MQQDDGKDCNATAVTDLQTTREDHKLQSYDEEVDKLIEWLRETPHLPNITGEHDARISEILVKLLQGRLRLHL